MIFHDVNFRGLECRLKRAKALGRDRVNAADDRVNDRVKVPRDRVNDRVKNEEEGNQEGLGHCLVY